MRPIRAMGTGWSSGARSEGQFRRGERSSQTRGVEQSGEDTDAG